MNREGYKDPTAETAVSRVYKESKKMSNKFLKGDMVKSFNKDGKAQFVVLLTDENEKGAFTAPVYKELLEGDKAVQVIATSGISYVKVAHLGFRNLADAEFIKIVTGKELVAIEKAITQMFEIEVGVEEEDEEIQKAIEEVQKLKEEQQAYLKDYDRLAGEYDKVTEELAQRERAYDVLKGQMDMLGRMYDTLLAKVSK